MSYYHDHAKEFIEDTINCDMSEQYRFFEKYVKKNGTILDVGFGSGRDSFYFKFKGYEVYSIDPEEKFVKYAKQLGLPNVYQMKAEDMDFEDKFDGIWACASLLHVPSNKLHDVFCLCSKALKHGGVIYASFKFGDFEGERNGRYYLDLNEETLAQHLNNSNLDIVEINKSIDIRPNRNDQWLNVLLKKID